MANGTNHDRLVEKIEALERRIEDRTARRDAEAAEVREAIADAIARLGNLEGNCAETRSAVSALQSVKPPGFLVLAGPAIAVAAAVGGLGSWALTKTVEPIEKSLVKLERDLRHFQDDQTGAVKYVMEKQDDVRTRLAKMEGRAEEQTKRLDDIDKIGSRKWVGDDPKER